MTYVQRDKPLTDLRFVSGLFEGAHTALFKSSAVVEKTKLLQIWHDMQLQLQEKPDQGFDFIQSKAEMRYDYQVSVAHLKSV